MRKSDVPGTWLQDMMLEVLEKGARKELYMQYRILLVLDQQAGRGRRSGDQEMRDSRSDARGFSPPPKGYVARVPQPGI